MGRLGSRPSPVNRPTDHPGAVRVRWQVAKRQEDAAPDRRWPGVRLRLGAARLDSELPSRNNDSESLYLESDHVAVAARVIRRRPGVGLGGSGSVAPGRRLRAAGESRGRQASESCHGIASPSQARGQRAPVRGRPYMIMIRVRPGACQQAQAKWPAPSRPGPA
jgi:hypothetical protein